MWVYYKYTANNTFDTSITLWLCDSSFWLCDWPAIVCNNLYDTYYEWDTPIRVCQVVDNWTIYYKQWTEFYMKKKPWYYAFNENMTYDWEYNVSYSSFSCDVSNNCILPENLKTSKVYITSEQTSNMWLSLVNSWSWLLHIWIQLIPYAIAFTIILIIFLIVKNRSRLKSTRQLHRIHKNKKRKERAEIIWKTHYDYFSNWPTIYKD